LKVFHDNKSESSESLEPIKPNRKKKLIILALVVLSLIFAGLAYYFLIYNKKTEATNNQSSQELIQIQDTPLTGIIYGFGESPRTAANVFGREFIGGSERKPLISLTNIGDVPENSFANNLLGFQVSNSYASIVKRKEIWVGKGQSKASLVYSHESVNSSIGIVASAINRDGKKVAFAIRNELSKTSQLWVLDVISKVATQIPGDINAAPFTWSADNNTIFLGPSLNSSQKQNPLPMAVTVATGEQKPLFDPTLTIESGAYNVSINGYMSAYIKATIDEETNRAGKPYKIFLRQLTNGQISEVKDMNSSDPPVSLAFDQLGETLYWTEDTKLFGYSTTSGGITEVFDTSEKDIAAIYAATGTQVLIGLEMPDKSFSIEILDLETKTTTQVMETTELTYAIGLLIDN